MSWVLRVEYLDGTLSVEEFDDDELGTLDDMLTRFFMTDLAGIDVFTVARQLPGWGRMA